MNSLLLNVSAPALPKVPESPFFSLPRMAGKGFEHVDGLYTFLVWVSFISGGLVVGAMIFFCVKYRAKSREDNEEVEESSTHNTALELTWSIAPLFFLVVMFVWGFRGYVDMHTPPRNAIEVHAIGQKWKWFFEYPSIGATDGELHVPVNQPVRVLISSVDVLHALYLPNFRTKQDAVPGRYTDLWFEAKETGEFPIFCAEYCGTSHSDMLSKIIVHSPESYQKWLEDVLKEPEDFATAGKPAAYGATFFEKFGCNQCHTTDGSAKVGPSWKGVFGKKRDFVGGSSVTADENYIRESIIDPQAKVVQGFQPVMPSFKGKLRDWQLNALVEYIKGLK